ncbi:MAG TPA: propionyl-CoA synthetase [Solirubrobacteraceae bacterium]
MEAPRRGSRRSAAEALGLALAGYAEVHARSLRDPEGFWGEIAQGIEWTHPPVRVLDDAKAPFYRWFPGGLLNTCHNAIDRHVQAGRGDQPALIYDSPVTASSETFTFAELLHSVAKFAGGLSRLGVDAGDRVVIYMPMVPEAVIAMLACARLGAIHAVVFGGFGAPELATRIDDVEPRVIVSASCGIEPQRVVEYKPLLEQAIALAASKPQRCVILQRPQARAALQPGRDLDWNEVLDDAEPVDPVPVPAEAPLYILHTSGTTAAPKGVVHDNGGHAVALNYSMDAIYGMRAGDVYWAASDIGWVVGHSYTVYGPLLHGCTTVLYEGKPTGTPDAGAFWRVIAQHNVNALFVAPTALRAIKRDDPEGLLAEPHDLSSLRTLFVAGERCDADTLLWVRSVTGVPVIDHWWQTETAWAIAANPVGVEQLEVKPGSVTRPAPGYDIRVLGDDGAELAPGRVGNIAVRLPLPPGSLLTLWRNDPGYVSAYLERFPGFYATGDGGYFDEDGYLWMLGRVDDVINVAGHRLSTGAIEEVIASHPAVAECAVVGLPDELKGEVPGAFVVLKEGEAGDVLDLAADLKQRVRDRVGPVASFRIVKVVPRLPKTRSGKILRGTMRRLAEGKEGRPPPTIEDPTTLDEVAKALQELGYPRQIAASPSPSPGS